MEWVAPNLKSSLSGQWECNKLQGSPVFCPPKFILIGEPNRRRHAGFHSWKKLTWNFWNFLKFLEKKLFFIFSNRKKYKNPLQKKKPSKIEKKVPKKPGEKWDFLSYDSFCRFFWPNPQSFSVSFWKTSVLCWTYQIEIFLVFTSKLLRAEM